MNQWYETLYKNSQNVYETQPFVKGTIGEVNFIDEELGHRTGCTVLDIGCGTGRHAIELAKRGYRVTGLDLSEDQLARARCNAEAAGVEVKFIRADARSFHFNHRFDAVTMICEGAFSLMETDEMNFQILKNAAASMKPSGTFIFTTLNGLYPLFHSVKDFINSKAGQEVIVANTFDLMTFRDHSEFEHADDSGNKTTLHCNERYYVPPEITWLLKSLGFGSIEIFGAELGNWSRSRPLTTENYEMLVVAKGVK